MKVTSKMLKGYLKAKKEAFGISENDNYNKDTYGITKREYLLIGKCIWDHSGFDGKIPTLEYINKNLKCE
jgi:hypothetical protein